MYAWIEGTLEHVEPTQVVLSTHGIGYLLAIPLRLFSELPSIGSKLRLYTSFQVRENHQALYGFGSAEERRCFDMLLHVTGIGPKVALAILGHMPPETLYTALYHKDIPALCAIPGIGKKSAERMLIEMRDRCQEQMHAFAEALPRNVAGHVAGNQRLDATARDARDALVQLGYSVAKAEQAVQAVIKQVDSPVPLSLLITRALKAI